MCMCERYSWLRPFCKHLQVLWARHTHTACSLPLAAWPVTAVKSLNRTGAWYKPAVVIKQAHFPFPWREKWVDEQRSKKQEKAPRRGDESGQRVTNAGFLQPANQQQQGRLKATGMNLFHFWISLPETSVEHQQNTHVHTNICIQTERLLPLWLVCYYRSADRSLI